MLNLLSGVRLKELIEILNRDRKANVCILNHIDDGKDFEYKIDGNIVIVRVVKGTDGKDTSLYIAGEGEISEQFIRSFIKDDDMMFCCVDQRFFEQLSSFSFTDWEEKCFRFVYENDKMDIELEHSIEDIREEDITIVDKNWTYTGSWSYSYLKSCIDDDISSAIYLENEIAGWCISHSDGSIGTLFVLDKFRNRGLAKDIMVSMTKKKLENSKLPFLFTVEENEKSINLVEKIGYTRYQKVFWMGIKL